MSGSWILGRLLVPAATVVKKSLLNNDIYFSLDIAECDTIKEVINKADDETGYTLLHYAVKYNDFETATKLITKGITTIIYFIEEEKMQWKGIQLSAWYSSKQCYSKIPNIFLKG